MDWQSVIGTAAGVVLGGAITWWFSSRTSRELRQEAERLRRLTITLTQILDGQGLIEVKEWDPETGEPKRWPVESSVQSGFRIEAPTPGWKRMWRKVFGG